MRGKVAKRLRKEALLRSIGVSRRVSRGIYKQLKKDYRMMVRCKFK